MQEVSVSQGGSLSFSFKVVQGLLVGARQGAEGVASCCRRSQTTNP